MCFTDNMGELDSLPFNILFEYVVLPKFIPGWPLIYTISVFRLYVLWGRPLLPPICLSNPFWCQSDFSQYVIAESAISSQSVQSHPDKYQNVDCICY